MDFSYRSSVARQLNGPIIDALLKSQHEAYAEAKDFIQHRDTFSLATATTQELNWVGVFLNIPRPYAVVDNEVILADDDLYRLILANTSGLRRSRSLRDLGRLLENVLNNGAYLLELQQNGDIRVTIDDAYASYVPFFQQVLDSVFNSLPRLTPIALQPLSEFIFNHILYARLLLLRDPEWITEVYGAEHIAYLTVPINKLQVRNHVLYQTTA